MSTQRTYTQQEVDKMLSTERQQHKEEMEKVREIGREDMVKDIEFLGRMESLSEKLLTGVDTDASQELNTMITDWISELKARLGYFDKSDAFSHPSPT